MLPITSMQVFVLYLNKHFYCYRFLSKDLIEKLQGRDGFIPISLIFHIHSHISYVHSICEYMKVLSYPELLLFQNGAKK